MQPNSEAFIEFTKVMLSVDFNFYRNLTMFEFADFGGHSKNKMAAFLQNLKSPLN